MKYRSNERVFIFEKKSYGIHIADDFDIKNIIQIQLTLWPKKYCKLLNHPV